MRAPGGMVSDGCAHGPALCECPSVYNEHPRCQSTPCFETGDGPSWSRLLTFARRSSILPSVMAEKRTFVVRDTVAVISHGSGHSLVLTSHSKLRLEQRQISDEDIFSTFRNPDHVYENKDYSNVHDYVRSFKTFTLRIGIKDDEAPFVLVTAFTLGNSGKRR